MTAVLSVEQIGHKVLLLRQRAANRDGRMGDVAAVRRGAIQDVYPGLLPDEWPRSIASNLVDVVARDLSEVVAPLPAFNCSSASMVSDRARKFADKRTKIAHYYALKSKVQKQMFSAADQYLTYGFLPGTVEPDFDEKIPRIRFEDPMNGYPEFNRWGRCISYTKVFRKPAHVLIAEYPEYAAQIAGPRDAYGNQPDLNETLELVRYHDDNTMLMFLPARDNLPLVQAKNDMGRCPWVIAMRPGLDDEQRGQFDDVIWIQIARAKMAMLGMEAAEKSVQAPLALPSDVQEMAFGPDAVLRSNTPEKIRRVGLELPPGAFQEQEILDTEQRVGARYPDGRTGNMDASVITGQGVQALMGGFDTQVKTAQEMFREMFRELFDLAFCMDETYWPNTSKTIRGEHAGAPFEITYRPSVDIKGDYTIDVSYGFAAGMDPNRALVFMLQLRGDKLVSRDLVQRQMPFDVNVSQLQTQIDVEETRDALKQAVFGLGQALPEMVAQGADPSATLAQFASLVQMLQKGQSIEDASAAAFAPPPAPPVDPNAPAQEGAPGAGGPGGTPGIGPDGQVSGVAPGQAGQGQGGRPALQALMAGLASSGSPTLSANVKQSVPVGG